MIDDIRQYGGSHPLVRPEGSPWLVVGGTGFNWRQIDEGAPAGKYSALDIHLDADDPRHVFLDAGEWHPLPGARKLAGQYNAPFRRSLRLRIKRATDYLSVHEIMAPHYRATDLLGLARLIRRDRDEAHIVGEFEWYPNGVVYERGTRLWTGL